MSDSSEWNHKGATLSHVTAQKEYGASYDFIVQGIRAGELEYREGSASGNPYLRVLRRQLEQYIVGQLGSEYLARKKTETELRAINAEIAKIRKRMTALQHRKAELEEAIGR